MDELLVLGGLFLLVIVIGVPYLLISHTRLKTRVADMERQLGRLSAGIPQPSDRRTPQDTETYPWGPPSAQPEQPLSDRRETPPATEPLTEPSAPETPPEPPRAEPPQPIAAQGETQDQVANATPKAFVFRKDRAAELSDWLRENWVLAVAAASLAFAGIFMVQYGVERGLLTPFWRVMSALGFGAALIAGGEVIRRRFGDRDDDGDGATAYLPSTLSGAGLIVLFAAVLSARVLYDLISPGQALAGLCGVSALAIVLGWFYGPVLAAVGILGATVAPFVVGGRSDTPWVFYYYFLLIAVAGLAVDTIRRWAWVSALVLIATLSAMTLLYLDDAGEHHYLLAVLITAFAAMTIPERRLTPHHGGPSFAEMLALRPGSRAFPEFPARIALGVVAAASIAAAHVAATGSTPDAVWLGFAALILLLVATLIWMSRAPALSDLALLPGAAFLFTLLNQAFDFGALYQQFRSPLGVTDPEIVPPDTSWIVYTLVALGAVVTLMAFWRMRDALRHDTGDTAPVIFALASAVFAPATVLILEFLWAPGPVLGQYPWALTAIVVAALMTLLAERCARGPDTARRKLRIGLFAVAALTLIALGFFLLLTKTALTLALAVMVLLIALLDRKLDLPLLGWFLQLGLAVISYRLIIDPGMNWAIRIDSDLQVLLAYGGTLAVLAAAWAMLRATPERQISQVITESALWTLAAVAMTVTLFRVFDEVDFKSHWGGGLLATVWLASAAAQVYRLSAPGLPLRWLRIVLAVIFALVGVLMLLIQAIDSNPLLTSREPVLGPPIFDSLAVAFLPVAAVLAVAAWKLTGLKPLFRKALIAISGLYGAIYVGLEIRRLWRGRDLSVPGVTDPELYSYTVALLLGAVLLLMLAFSRRSVTLRKLAMIGVGLTIAKVFLIDMSGLSGLTRVFSFMGLGLALVGLAWLNRKMTAQWDRGTPDAPGENAGDPSPGDTP